MMSALPTVKTRSPSLPAYTLYIGLLARYHPQREEATISQRIVPSNRPRHETLDLPVDVLIRQLDFWLKPDQNGSLRLTFSEAEWQALRDQFYRLWKQAVEIIDEATAQVLMVLMDGAEFTLREYVTPRLLMVLREGLLQFHTREYFTLEDAHTWHRAILKAGGRVIGPVSNVAILLD